MTDETTHLLRNDEETGHQLPGRKLSGIVGWFSNMLYDFKNFINKGSVLDLAVGIVIGEAFSSVVGSFVTDIFSPFLGLIVSSKLSEAFIVIKKGPHFPYITRDEARKDGAVTWNYGNFMQLMINFFCVSVCLFVVIRMSQSIHRKRVSERKTKECPLCYSDIDGRAIRCSKCGGEIPRDE